MAHGAHDVAALREGLAALQQGYASLQQELRVLRAQLAEESSDRALVVALPVEDSLGDVVTYSWVIGCGMLVFFMQAGFALVEAGTCRVKNVMSILAKNQVDFIVASFAWFLIGWAFAFGDSEPTAGVVGTTEFVGTMFFDGNKLSDDAFMFYFNQMFCAVAATIVSGGIAERATLKGYIFFSFIMSSCIYPVVVCWCWNPNGWLVTRGFYDFAGSGVVHLTGGMGALAGAWILGPRAGRFGSVATQDSNEFNPHSMPFIAMGTLILQFGWYGFNAGSTGTMQSESDAKAAVLTCINTTVSAAAAAVMATAVRLLQSRRWDVPAVCNGILAGCVSITAGCAIVGPWSAMLIGAVGGAIFCFTGQALARFRIDDPVGAFPVHGACGTWGVLAVALFHTGSNAVGDPSPGPGLLVQLQGVVAIATYSGVMCLCVFALVRRLGTLDHNVVEQRQGLDRSFTQTAYSTGEVTRFLAFISHAKASHGACARWLQLELAAYAGGKSRIFLDSDNLVNLNHLLSTVRDKVACVVVLASNEIWWRPWCAGEIAVAMHCDVPIVLVMMEEAGAPLRLDFAHIASQVPQKIPSDAMETLRPFGLAYEDIQSAYRKLSACPQVSYGVFSDRETRRAIAQIATHAGLQQSRGAEALNSLGMHLVGVDFGEGRLRKSLSEWWHSSAKWPNYVILCDVEDIEAVAASHILEKALMQAAEQHSNSVMVATCAGMAEERVLQLVSSRATVILVLSKGTLSCRLVHRACILCAARLWPDGQVRSVTEDAGGSGGLPVVVDPELGFQFPTQAFYDSLMEDQAHLHRELEMITSSQKLLRARSSSNFAWDALELPYPSVESAAMALSGFFRLVFQQIASPLSTHRSWKAIQQQTYWIYERASAARRTPASAAANNDKASRRVSRVHLDIDESPARLKTHLWEPSCMGSTVDAVRVGGKDAQTDSNAKTSSPSQLRRTIPV